MQIAIIGTGRMANNLATGWNKAGHDVVMGSRAPAEKGDLDFPVVSNEEALAHGEVVLLALPFTAVASFAADHAEQLRPKLIIDISNPFANQPDDQVGGAELTAQAIGAGARVIAAFKTNFWDTLLEPEDPETGVQRDVLFTGGDAQDKETAATLIRDLGFRPVDCGALSNSHILDVMTPLIVELDQRYTGGQRRAFWKLMA